MFDGKIELFSHPEVDTKNVSGTGDSFSAALCCQLAFGLQLSDAIANASRLTHYAIEQGADWGAHWAFVAPRQYAPPKNESDQWSRQPIRPLKS